jgi:NAD dependent epimerase/dehydratase family enzyme
VEDLVKMYLHIIEKQLEGPFNAVTDACSNKDFMKSIAKVLHKPFWFPKVPGFVMRMMYGEMSIILLNGVKASNDKILKTGFHFKYTNLEEALQETLIS